MNPLLKCSDMVRDSKGITQFYLPPTHEPYFTPQSQSITALWLVLIAPTHGGMARLSSPGWLVIYWDRFSRTGSWTSDTVTHPSTNRVRRRLTVNVTNALTTTPNRQPAITCDDYYLISEKINTFIRKRITLFDCMLRSPSVAYRYIETVSLYRNCLLCNASQIR